MILCLICEHIVNKYTAKESAILLILDFMQVSVIYATANLMEKKYFYNGFVIKNSKVLLIHDKE